VQPPETRYAKSGDVHVAYQVLGHGPTDLVLIPGFISHLEHQWEEPGLAHTLTRLASFSRLIMVDKRGTGLSDRGVGLPTLDERMDDVRAVMDAAGSDQAALFGISEGGSMAMLFTATYPERTRALILWGAYARLLKAPDYPAGVSPKLFEQTAPYIEPRWGTGVGFGAWMPSCAKDERARAWFAKAQRLAASPADAVALLTTYNLIDARDALPIISRPTLVLHRVGDRMIPVELARYVADHIPGARLVEFPGEDHILMRNQDPVIDEIQEFITGVRPQAEPDRLLSTVLFTDIVESTRLAAEAGDRRWREILERHEDVVRRELERYRGRAVKTMGDGFLATFDGPARAVRCAEAIRGELRLDGVEIRAGLHTGEIEVMGEDVGGIAVHIAARVAAMAGGGETLVSSTVKDLVVGSGIEFEDRGAHELKGVPGEWRVFAVTSA
jgi:pimeloyl-ACP methyl ester carboxylesterase/class 3 adenylate cyclase